MPYGNEAFELIRNNESRDKQIVKDVVESINAGRTPVVLTKFVDHANRLADMLKETADKVILLTGADGTKGRRAQIDTLREVSDDQSLILVGTGSLLGEGFDYPRLDTLFMATPVSGESVVEQYVGRLNRDYEGKEKVIVYDYVDSHIPKFDKMYTARLRVYKKIGYELCTGIDGEKQEAGSIFDPESYSDIYWQDISEAKNSIIISSPNLSAYKVDRLIKTVYAHQQLGVKISIATWHQDFYKHGNDIHRLELIERLRQAGFEICLVKESCEHFAVIDNEIVWYGNINLLSKENVDDNIMRVVSEEIAEELLEVAFG